MIIPEELNIQQVFHLLSIEIIVSGDSRHNILVLNGKYNHLLSVFYFN